MHKYPHELSGGQRQRVAIARALAVQPRVLLADEPVSMLDVSIRLGVLNLLADLRDRDQLAILYITHDIASARYLADTIVVMYAGQVVESGPAVQVTDSPAHPYTQLLLSAAPDPERTTPVTLRGAGAPPSARGAAIRLPVPHCGARTRWRSAPSRRRRPSPPATATSARAGCSTRSPRTAAALTPGPTPAPATTAGGEAASRFPADRPAVGRAPRRCRTRLTSGEER